MFGTPADMNNDEDSIFLCFRSPSFKHEPYVLEPKHSSSYNRNIKLVCFRTKVISNDFPAATIKTGAISSEPMGAVSALTHKELSCGARENGYSMRALYNVPSWTMRCMDAGY